jgi:ACS family allantoate permease-like MFS transporter
MSNASPPDVEKVTMAVDDGAHSPSQPTEIIDTKLLKHSHDADAAMKAFEGMDGQVIELSEQRNKALLRKIDWHFMPVSLLPSKCLPLKYRC